MIFPFLGVEPRIGSDCFIAESADLIGDVEVGDTSSVWYRAVLRGDVNWIRVGEASNIQDGAVIHVTNRQHPTRIGRHVTVGHSAVVHGCTVKDRVLVGIGATVLDGAVIESDSMIGAGALVPPGAQIPPRSLVLGVPGKVVRELCDEEIVGIKESAIRYVHYAAIYSGKLDIDENPFYDRE